MEGGYNDRLGKPLQTLQGFLSGRHKYVAVAMDSTAFPYGTILKIPSLNKKYGKNITFCVVDTGGAFKGKKTTRMDICVQNRQASYDAAINTSFTYEVVRRGNGRSC
jgi:3D (Asp-Asp-Asp) domain-containing protein